MLRVGVRAVAWGHPGIITDWSPLQNTFLLHRDDGTDYWYPENQLRKEGETMAEVWTPSEGEAVRVVDRDSNDFGKVGHLSIIRQAYDPGVATMYGVTFGDNVLRYFKRAGLTWVNLDTRPDLTPAPDPVPEPQYSPAEALSRAGALLEEAGWQLKSGGRFSLPMGFNDESMRHTPRHEEAYWTIEAKRGGNRVEIHGNDPAEMLRLVFRGFE